MNKRNIIIVGGGASGIVAAIAAAREGAKVTIIEQKDRIGKKILSTGNGRCNLTNEYMNTDCFRGDNTAIVSEVLDRFGYQQTIDFFEKLGVITKSKQGYVYPISEQASTILDVLRMELSRLHVTIKVNERVTEIQKQQDRFYVKTTTGVLSADALILATGGRAAPALGSDGSGYKLAKQMGHHICEVVPALVQLQGKGEYFKSIAGVRTHAKIQLFVDGQLVTDDCGELQITNYGISGIPVFQVSRYAAKAHLRNKQVLAEIDFLPTMTEDAFVSFMQERKEKQGYKTAEEFCVGIFHKKLIGMLLKQVKISVSTLIKDVKDKQFFDFLYLCKHFQVEITGTNSFEHAQICAGGVKTTEINPQSMQSIYDENLYITGELLDIDGICGGYNLQWAWATGFIAGYHAAKGK